MHSLAVVVCVQVTSEASGLLIVVDKDAYNRVCRVADDQVAPGETPFAGGWPCCRTASWVDTSTGRPRRPLKLCKWCLDVRIPLFRDARACVRSFPYTCGSGERGLPFCAAARVWTGGARADAGMYTLCTRHIQAVSVSLLFYKCYYITYCAIQHSRLV